MRSLTIWLIIISLLKFFIFLACLFINFDIWGIEEIFLIENKPALRPSSKSWLLYAISSEIAATWASSDGYILKTILLSSLVV